MMHLKLCSYGLYLKAKPILGKLVLTMGHKGLIMFLEREKIRNFILSRSSL